MADRSDATADPLLCLIVPHILQIMFGSAGADRDDSTDLLIGSIPQFQCRSRSEDDRPAHMGTTSRQCALGGLPVARGPSHLVRAAVTENLVRPIMVTLEVGADGDAGLGPRSRTVPPYLSFPGDSAIQLSMKACSPDRGSRPDGGSRPPAGLARRRQSDPGLEHRADKRLGLHRSLPPANQGGSPIANRLRRANESGSDTAIAVPPTLPPGSSDSHWPATR